MTKKSTTLFSKDADKLFKILKRTPLNEVLNASHKFVSFRDYCDWLITQHWTWTEVQDEEFKRNIK